MARGRIISNRICADKKVNTLVDDTSRLAFTWLITFADCEGRVDGDPSVVAAKLFPRRRDITPEMMEGYIAEWAELGLIQWYESDGDMWIQFPNFVAHQPGLRKDKEAPSCIPPPKDGVKTELRRSKDGVTPVEEKVIEGNRREAATRACDTTGETDSPFPAASCSLSLCSLFFKLNARHASDNDRKLNKELAARADWVEHVALTAMDLCHRCAVEREPNFVAKSLRYYADAITRALETGQLPGQESQKNGGRNGSRVGAFLAQGFQPYNAAGKTYYLDDSMIYKTNTMPTQEMIDDELDKYEREHPERVVVNDA